MNRGTACLRFDASGSILGLDYVPSRSQQLDALGQFLRSPAAGAASFGLTGGTPNPLDSSTKDLFQRAHYALEQGDRLESEIISALGGLVGSLEMRPLPDRGVVVQVHRDPTSVFAQTAVEMALESRKHHQVRHCAICGGSLTGHGNAKTCSPVCKQKRKQKTDRQRYRRQTAEL